MKTNQQHISKPDLLSQLEKLGFSWEDRDKSDNEQEVYIGFNELEKFFILSAKPENRVKTLSVSGYLDKKFWHPVIEFLNENYQGGYDKFCLDTYNSLIPHFECPPNYQAYLITADLIKKHFDSGCFNYIWSPNNKCHGCTKAPVPL